jgi:hypothetical protein
VLLGCVSGGERDGPEAVPGGKRGEVMPEVYIFANGQRTVGPHADDVAAALGVLLLFLLDGALNGWLLFGRPNDAGSLVNLGAAAIIGALAVSGRR